MKENMKLKDQIMAKDVEISLLKESLIENGNHTIRNDHTNDNTIRAMITGGDNSDSDRSWLFCHQFQKSYQHPFTIQCH